MTLYLIRHAHAGSRHQWSGPDEMRPLSAKGMRQAERIADQFGDDDVKRVLSSPALRCIETVEPLAARVGVSVEAKDTLAEGAPVGPALELLQELAEDAVPVALCSHGDLIPAIVRALKASGLISEGETVSAKAGSFVLDTDDGRISHAFYVPPPDVGDHHD